MDWYPTPMTITAAPPTGERSADCSPARGSASGQEVKKEQRLLELLREIEQHCPCGARPETPNTHPHVSGCPVNEAIRLLMTPNKVI